MTSSSAADVLTRALLDRLPCVLFIGQAAWAPPVGAPLLEMFLGHLGRPHPATWRAVLHPTVAATDYAWLTERFERNVISEAMQAALDLPWAAVYSCAPDHKLLRRLETRGRQPEGITAIDQFPHAARNSSRPPVYFLFGRADTTQDSSRCPASARDLLSREMHHAAGLLGRLKETVTTAGVLVVDGLDADGEWLRLDSLLAFLPPTGGIRVLWFGTTDTHRAKPLFQDLITSGVIVSESKRLPDVVAEIRAGGELDDLSASLRHDAGIVSLNGGGALVVSPSLRLRVEASAAIVEDDWTAPPPAVDEGTERDSFRRFHGDLVSARGLVEGILRGFAIERPFEKTLRKRVSEALERRQDVDQLLVLHGQSGTGKSLALARLAATVRTDLSIPVLYAIGRLPEASDVDTFCAESERAGAGATLVLCDANQGPDRYFQLSHALRSKGRRVVIVATSYRIDKALASKPSFLEAVTDVTPAERRALDALLARFAEDGGLRPLSVSVLNDENVFALLYRLLSASRQRLISGISSEARAAEYAIRERSRRSTGTPQRFATQLADALVLAGRHDGAIPLFDASETGDDSFGNDAPGRLIDYVMAAGRIGQYVPLNLLMRALRAHDTELDFHRIASLFDELDLFRWKFGDEQQSELLVGPRLKLEAELICRRRLADPARELNALVELIASVRPRSVDQDSEMRFLIDLLRQIDHDGPRGDAYADGYLQIGRALTVLRTKHGLEDARIMLQESNLRRAWLRSRRAAEEPSREDRDRVLDEARQVVEEALRRIAELKPSRRTKENLLVERASIYGFLAVGHAQADAPLDVVWSDYAAARAAGRRAIGFAPGYFPFDVALWTPADLLDTRPDLSPSQRAELIADIYAVLDRIDPDDLPPSQVEKFHIRRGKVGRAIADDVLRADARSALAGVNPGVALYLDAREACPQLFDTQALTEPGPLRDAAARAAAILCAKAALTMSDARCLRLLLELEWASATGGRLLRGERRPIPSEQSVRLDLLGLVRELHAVEGDSLDFSMRYLEGVLSWLCRDKQAAREIWRALGHDTEFEDPRRVHRRLFVADSHGKPQRYRGRLKSVRGRWRILVEGLDEEVDLVERDFRESELRPGFEIRDFAVAFNYLGPVADPMSRYEVSK